MSKFISSTPINFDQRLIGIIKRVYKDDTLILKGFNVVNEKKITGFISKKSHNQLSKKFKKLPGLLNTKSFNNLSKNDIIGIYPNGTCELLFKQDSEHNSLFVTEKCNNNCIMCSQPRVRKDDIQENYTLNMNLINLLPKKTLSIGITGGEPTLLDNRLYFLLEKLAKRLEKTAIHILTNGRRFSDLNYTQILSSLSANERITFGVPVFSDYYQDHDFITQVKNSFYQTMQGLYNLARYDQNIELRIILQKHCVKRLDKLAKYILKNLPFTQHVAFMGIELCGNALRNIDYVWIDPDIYNKLLIESVSLLKMNGMDVSIYNIPLCLLPESLWKYSVNSISDWKREYYTFCDQCSARLLCGGVFESSKDFLRRIILEPI